MEPTIKTNSSCKIFVGNVPFDCTDNEFKDAFIHFDGYLNAELISRSQTNNTRGFGFVAFINSDYVNKFLEKKEKIIIKDRTLRFTKYTEKNDSNFIIKNLKKKYLNLKKCINSIFH